MTVELLRPGISHGAYPQKLAAPPGPLEQRGRYWLKWLRAAVERRHSLAKIVARVDRAGQGLESVDDAALAAFLTNVRYVLLRDGLEEIPVLRAFAMVREYAARTLGMRHYDEQLFGAWVIVNGGMAEMATGEGKSLTATLAAATAALAGIPVHVITTNEYLAQRDADEMRPLFEALGLSVAPVLEAMGTAEKEVAYRSDVVYLTNKQVAFDYLRDRLISSKESGPLSLRFSRAQLQHQLVMRGLCFAIIDEADSVLIDEARTPLILSREHEDANQQEIVERALALAAAMQPSKHYWVYERERAVELTDTGMQWLTEQIESLEGVWASIRHAEFLVHQALSAQHLYERNIHYLVRDERVEIIDRNTGRTMADRSWQRGLHQMIECKEGCQMTGYRETLASISYQRFFRRYLRLGGMSGTLQQVAGELRSVYQQQVVQVPTHRPCRRRDLGFYLYRRAEDKWLGVLKTVERIAATGQPLLVGSGSVGDSELFAQLLRRRGFEPQVLNAMQDSMEAEIIAAAGQRGQITIATSMAGRGTDIALGPGVSELGGLHVINTECHEEYRVDRQLVGRCSRQGDPGSFETHVCLNDPLLKTFYPLSLRRMLGRYLAVQKPVAGRSIRYFVRFAQWHMSRQYRLERREVMHMNEKLGKILAYTGRQE